MTRDASDGANNQDALVWALWLLGGADEEVDVEEIYLKCFEIAPARLGWRTRPDIPDYKKTSKALQSVEAKELPGLLHKPDSLHRRLTPEGIAWVERNEPTLQRLYGGEVPVAGSSQGAHEPLRRRLKSSDAYDQFRLEEDPGLLELAEAFECTPSSPDQVWTGRFVAAERAARVLQDDELADFVSVAKQIVERGW
jgi:hypothetical protein